VKRWIVVALALTTTGGILGALAWKAPAQGQSSRFALLTMADLDDQQRPVGQPTTAFSRAGLGGHDYMLQSPPAASRMPDLLDYLRFHSSVPTRLNEFAILIQGRLWRSQMELWGHTLNGTYVAVASLVAMARQGVPPGEQAAFGPDDT
jgi:4-carboxymuconolactone decarboxylase